ncbi:MFS transporter [Paenibacillus taichungensis]|uniref:MFS transporter n=1 Tax=Paenibacillus taichungensis TaxID=484184 RepID=A0A329R4X2_9BACL|nr:MFS transporter [Paenibacillus taichungensis]RAW19571.1 MFS transporter [Paenibacillus taichungensis]
MDKRAVKAWIMYDWANSAYATTVLAAVLPVFYASVAAATLDTETAASYLAYTHSIGMLCVALLTPLLGTLADLSGRKGDFLRVFSIIGIVATLGFSIIGEGDWLLASALLVISTIGFAGGNTFYDAMLPDLVSADRRDMISSKGYAYGYIGGGLLLAINMLMIQQPGWFGMASTLSGTRLAFISVALWWLVFSIPLFRHAPRRPAAPDMPKSWKGYAGVGVRRLGQTFRQIRRFPQLMRMLVAFWFFNDGINTIILMATIYGTSIGIGTADLMLALLLTQFIGFPCTLLLGAWAQRWGAKQVLMVSLSIYICIVILGYFMTSAIHFYLLAGLVGVVQGVSQSTARSLFSNLMPAGRTGEYFGFVNITGKFSSIFGPFVFGWVGQLTGSTRWGILSLIFFFAAGIAVLVTVKVQQGMSDAIQADQEEGQGWMHHPISGKNSEARSTG